MSARAMTAISGGVRRLLAGRASLDIPEADGGALTVADRVAPGQLIIDEYDDTIVLEECCARVWAISNVPGILTLEQLHNLYYGQRLPLRVVLNWRVEAAPLARRLVRRRVVEVEAENIRRSRGGRIPDMTRQNEAAELYRQMERQEVEGEPLLWLSMLLCLYGRTKEELDEGAKALERALSDKNFDAIVIRDDQDLAIETAMPLGLRTKCLDIERSASPGMLAMLYPHGVQGFDEDRGVVLGLHPFRDTVVRVDLFRSMNLTTILTGRPGAGKTTLMKSMVEQAAIAGDDVSVIDLEGEYVGVVRDLLGGQVIDLGDTAAAINPLDPALANDPEQAFTDLVELLSIMSEQDINGAVRSCIEDAWNTVRSCEQQPVLSDLVDLLHVNDRTRDLAAALRPYTEGQFEAFFNQRTNVRLQGRLRCFVLKRAVHVGPAGRALLFLAQKFGMFGGLDVTGRSWTFIDEGWRYFGDSRDAQRLVELVVRARKRTHAVVIVTPDAAQIGQKEAGQVLLRQSATHIMMEQDETALRAYRAHTLANIDDGDMANIISSPVGRGLLITHRADNPEPWRVPFDVLRLPGRDAIYGSHTDPSLLPVAA